MSKRVWMASIAIILGMALAVTRAPAGIVLRSSHASPAVAVPVGDVIVTAEGKLFHRAGCTYIHGRPLTLTAREAVHRGYTPCIRCISGSRPRGVVPSSG